MSGEYQAIVFCDDQLAEMLGNHPGALEETLVKEVHVGYVDKKIMAPLGLSTLPRAPCMTEPLSQGNNVQIATKGSIIPTGCVSKGNQYHSVGPILPLFGPQHPIKKTNITPDL